MWSAAVAGSVAGFANMAFGWEQFGWGELLAVLGNGRSGRAAHRARPRPERGLGQFLESTGEALAGPGLPPKWAGNGQPDNSRFR
jgi:hypothetical protein